ncbi:uncharacterized protein LOC143036805 [Oratosquilla oratoria]|uniref:uncharacterized protein LOC143036805 n=1 Tax=Oratosquilla oratoria TaxID=337810 RepID=UPI003F76A57F
MASCTICSKLPSNSARNFLDVQGDAEVEHRIGFSTGEHPKREASASVFGSSRQTLVGVSDFHHENHACSLCYNSDEFAYAQERSRLPQIIERFFILPRSTVKASPMLVPNGNTKCRVSETKAVYFRSSLKKSGQCINIDEVVLVPSISSRLTSDPCGERLLTSSDCWSSSPTKECVLREVSSFPKSFSKRDDQRAVTSPKECVLPNISSFPKSLSKGDGSKAGASTLECVIREVSSFPKSIPRTEDQKAVASTARHSIHSNVNTNNGTHRSSRRERKTIPQELLPLSAEATDQADTIVASERTQGTVATMSTTSAATTKVVKGSQPLLVLVLFLLLSPTLALSASRLDTSRGSSSGHYDRGGPQHRITWGRGNPQASAVFGDTPTNVTAIVGHRARLPCTVRNLGLKDVTWIRQRDLHILTVGISTYTNDDRFTVYHKPETEDWFLDISSVTFRDSGIYECQVTTSPKVSLPVHLTVLAEQEATIQGPKEVYIRTGSTISLVCEVPASWEAVGPVHWFLSRKRLDYSSPRGGISMEVEKTPSHTTSKLFITRAVKADSGEYKCAPKYAKHSSVTIHIVNGEESRAVHSGGKGLMSLGTSSCAQLVFVCVIFLCARQTRSWH